ncbi:MAG: aminopeptidase P family protein [Lewinella sp.]|nr:aminopeptidase P family protein [Lewinella sp.]
MTNEPTGEKTILSVLYLTPMTTPEKIKRLRAAMHKKGLDAYLVNGNDPHQSEYVAEHWQARAWLSGFDGSAGTLIVTADEALLWTDSRYFIQAEQQLVGSGIQLMRSGLAEVPEPNAWLAAALAPPAWIGVDGQLLSVVAAERLERKLQMAGHRLELGYDLLAEVWERRPSLPATPPFAHPPTFTETPFTERLGRLQNFLVQEALDYYLLVGLDEIAWLLCIRAQDVAYNPLCLSYLLVGQGGALWFVGPKRIATPLRGELASAGVRLAAYADVTTELLRISNGTQAKVGIDPALASVAIYQAAGGTRARQVSSPISGWKSRKGPRELAHLSRAMVRDGVALLHLRRWLELKGAPQHLSEVAVAEQLTHFRSQQEHYQGDSFPAIVGYQANGAIVHYHARAESCAQLSPTGLLLLDSGGQYLDGTTDVTRTFALGLPTPAQRLHFTLVLQGHLDLARAVFPIGTVGLQLDTLARRNLWAHQLDYGHGTGHGVGYFLNVHEGPMSIRANATPASTRVALEPGMVLSNEPGYYVPGEYGIRIENLVVVVEKSPGWLGFQDLTLFPIEAALIDTTLLSKDQLSALNHYHQKVWEGLSPALEAAADLEWLLQACAPLA